MIDHHAVLLEGKSLVTSVFYPELVDETTELETLQFEVLTIGDVRKIIQTAFAKPFAAATKTMVLEAMSIASEAQQALLKVLEEPPQTTKFILVLPSAEGLLPTLLSRLERPQGHGRIPYGNNSLFTIFQASSYAARLECIARLTKDKDAAQIEQLRDGVMWYLEQKPTSTLAATLYLCVTNLSTRGASKKMLLEEIALTLPVVA